MAFWTYAYSVCFFIDFPFQNRRENHKNQKEKSLAGSPSKDTSEFIVLSVIRSFIFFCIVQNELRVCDASSSFQIGKNKKLSIILIIL